MFKTFEKEIGENKYTIVAFTGSKGLDLMFEFIGYASTFLKLFSSDLSSSFSLKSVLEATLQEDAIDKVIDAMQEMLLVKDSRDKLIHFIRQLVSDTTRNGKEDLSKKELFDMIFAANYEELFALTKEVIVVNFFSQNFIQKMMTKKIQQEQKSNNSKTK
jgi:hypothetical protein